MGIDLLIIMFEYTTSKYSAIKGQYLNVHITVWALN